MIVTKMRQEWCNKVEGLVKNVKIRTFFLVLMACQAAFFAPRNTYAATSRYFWSDPSTGFAIGGFDPLSYFTTRRPKRGIEEYEFEWHGVTFRFVNQGNMAEFSKYPEIYAPRYGGYDAYSMADGKLVEGNPNIWMKRKNRIYLFASRKNRALWLVRRDDKISEANRYWNEISKDLIE
jgi:YHS domain-containing protein